MSWVKHCAFHLGLRSNYCDELLSEEELEDIAREREEFMKQGYKIEPTLQERASMKCLGFGKKLGDLPEAVEWVTYDDGVRSLNITGYKFGGPVIYSLQFFVGGKYQFFFDIGANTAVLADVFEYGKRLENECGAEYQPRSVIERIICEFEK